MGIAVDDAIVREIGHAAATPGLHPADDADFGHLALAARRAAHTGGLSPGTQWFRWRIGPRDWNWRRRLFHRHRCVRIGLIRRLARRLRRIGQGDAARHFAVTSSSRTGAGVSATCRSAARARDSATERTLSGCSANSSSERPVTSYSSPLWKRGGPIRPARWCPAGNARHGRRQPRAA